MRQCSRVQQTITAPSEAVVFIDSFTQAGQVRCCNLFTAGGRHHTVQKLILRHLGSRSDGGRAMIEL